MQVFLQELLMQQPKKQAIIFLKDVTFSNLQALIHVTYISQNLFLRLLIIILLFFAVHVQG